MANFHQLYPNDTFVITGTEDYLKKQEEFFLNSTMFWICKREYYPHPWWKFWKPKVLKSLIIMYLGEK